MSAGDLSFRVPSGAETVLHHHHEETSADFPGITAERLAIMKINAEADRDVFSDMGSPKHMGKSSSFRSSHSAAGARSLARSTRHVSNASRRNSFMQTHRSKMSMELSAQAESKFFALMELMTSASREAGSLKEYWQKLMSERESWEREREELSSQLEEITETLEQRDSQHHHHGRELGERKKEVEKLLVELSSALNHITVEKKKVNDRDLELDRSRTELSELRLNISRQTIDQDKLKSELDTLLTRFKAVEHERDHAKEDAEKYRNELRTFTREHAELKGKNSTLEDRLELSHKEVHTLTDRLRNWESERDAHLVEKDRLQEELRKVAHRADEATRELADLTERYERATREFRQIKENIRFVESERDDHATTIDRLRHELRSKGTSSEETETRLADILVKYEQAKREVSSKEERIRDIEAELGALRGRIEHSHEDYQKIIIERDSYKDDLEHERRSGLDFQRQLEALRGTHSTTESTLAEVRQEVYTVTEKIKHVERERDEARHHHGHLGSEITSLKERLQYLQIEVRTVTEHRDRARKDLDEVKRRYEEVEETITEFKGDSSELECEIESLRILLREAREQKERAIAARTTADRERDEYVTKYEEKCREMERAEEGHASSFSHSHGHVHGNGNGASRSSSTRIVKRSGSSFQQQHSALDANGE